MTGFIGGWLKTFSACFCALLLAIALQAKADPPTGNGAPALSITSPNSTIAVGGTSYSPTLDLAGTQGLPLTWNGIQTFSAVSNYVGTAGTCSNPPATLATGACFAGNSGTAVEALFLGPVTGGTSCTSSCTAEPSMEICYGPMTASGIAVYCDSTVANGTHYLAGTLISTNGVPFQPGVLEQPSSCSGSSPVTGGAGDYACKVTSVSSTAELDFAVAYTSTPNCTASDQTAATALRVLPVPAKVTVTGQGATDLINIICVANNT